MRSTDAWWVARASVLGVALAVVAAISPALIHAAILAACVPFLPRSALMRSGFLVFGGLATLHSGVDQLTTDKLVYAAGVAVATLVAVARIAQAGRRDDVALRVLCPFSAAFLLMCVVSAAVAASQGTSGSDWLRDTTPYALVALVPVFASDLAANIPDWRVIAALFVPAAVASTVAFTLEWLFLRHVIDFDAAVLLSSFFFPAALFAFCVTGCVFGTSARSRVLSLGGALSVMLLQFATGTRSSVVLVAGIVPALIPLMTGMSGVSRRGLVLTLVSVLAVLSVSAVVIASADGTVGSRLRGIPNVVRDPTSDQSYRVREQAWSESWRVFEDKPLLGAGTGHRFVWTLPSGRERSGYNVDSPLGFPAKFGLLGLVLLGAAATSLVIFMVATYRRAAAVPWWAGVSFLVMLLVWVPLGVPFEEKGMPLGLLWLLAMIAASASRPLSSQDVDGTRLAWRLWHSRAVEDRRFGVA